MCLCGILLNKKNHRSIRQGALYGNRSADIENMTILGCRVKKDYAARFRAACVAAGTTPNAVLKQAADDFLKEHPADEDAPTEE